MIATGLRVMLVAGLVAAAAGPVVRAQDEGTEDRAEICRRVVGRMMAALQEGDAATIERLIARDGRMQSQRIGAAAIAECVAAQRALERAVAARWGTAAAGFVAGDAAIVPADRAALAEARIEAGDRTAAVFVGTGRPPVLLRRNRDNEWRVVITAVSMLVDGRGAPELGSQRRIEHFRTVTRVLRQAAQDVTAGRQRSPEDVRAAVQKALDDAENAPSAGSATPGSAAAPNPAAGAANGPATPGGRPAGG